MVKSKHTIYKNGVKVEGDGCPWEQLPANYPGLENRPQENLWGIWEDTDGEDVE